MKKLFVFIFAALLVLSLTPSAFAILIDRGGGMIYSADLDVTWLMDANYAMTSGYDDDGLMTWQEANAWAQNLSYGGYDDWRLPTFDINYNRDDASVESELSYLRYVELGPPYSSSLPFDPYPFINMTENDPYIWYWSGSFSGPSNAWRFSFTCG